jgi:hypothetical protein
MLFSTFEEAFADLVALTYTDIEPYDRDLARDPQKFLQAYEKLSSALDSGKRVEEISGLKGLGLAIHEGRYDDASERALDLVNLSQRGGEIVEIRSLRKDVVGEEYNWKLAEDSRYSSSNMFVDNVRFNNVPYSRILQNELDLWRKTEILDFDTESLERPLRRAYKEESNFSSYIDSNAEKMFGSTGLEALEGNEEELLVQTAHSKINETHQMLQDYMEGLRRQNRPERF